MTSTREKSLMFDWIEEHKLEFRIVFDVAYNRWNIFNLRTGGITQGLDQLDETLRIAAPQLSSEHSASK